MNSAANRIVMSTTLALAVVAVLVLRISFTPRTDPCADPDRLRSLALFQGTHNLTTHIDQERDQPLWVEGVLGDGSLTGNPSSFRFIRSYDVARFIQSGLLLLRNFPLPLDHAEVRIVEIDGRDVPVHIRTRETGNSPFVTGYVIAVGNDPVTSPARGVLQRLLDTPWNGPKPLTIMLVESPRLGGSIEEQSAFILDWLTAGWREFQSACST